MKLSKVLSADQLSQISSFEIEGDVKIKAEPAQYKVTIETNDAGKINWLQNKGFT